jgi:hypothetical protein
MPKKFNPFIYIDKRGKMHNLEIEEYRIDMQPKIPEIVDISTDSEIALRATVTFYTPVVRYANTFIGIDMGRDDTPVQNKDSEVMDF